MGPWVVFVLFLLAGFAIYAPALKGGPIWDDNILVGDNPFFRSPVFATEVFRHRLIEESPSNYYRPVQNLSYMADYWLSGGSLIGYHVSNVLIHVFAAWLLYLLLLRLLPGLLENPRIASIAALLVSLGWLVHPAHNAAVAYISGRADSLAAMFAAGAWLLWMKACEMRNLPARSALAACAAVALLAAFCSKEIAMVWLGLFAMHAVFFERRTPWARRIAATAGGCVVLAVYGFLRSLPAAGAAAEAAVHEPLMSRVVLMFRALGDYTGLMLAPVRLMMERSLGPTGVCVNRGGWWPSICSEHLAILGLVSLAAAVWACSRRGPGKSLRRFGTLWFAIAFLPISNLFPLNARVAEHWIYLASVGFLLLLAGVAAMLPRAAMQRVAAAAGCAIVLLGVRTAFRAADWADAETFIQKTIANGGGTPRMLAYGAQELGAKGRFAEQEQVYRRMIALYPDYTVARTNLGLCLQRQGRDEEARQYLGPAGEKTVATVPRTWEQALNLARRQNQDGRAGEALELTRNWRRQFPGRWELAGCEAAILRDMGKMGEALEAAGEFARAHWWHLPAQLGTAALFRDAGDYESALAIALRAQRLDIHGAAAFDESARSQFALGRLDAALESQAEAVARAPRHAEYLDFFASILQALGREQEALVARRRAAMIAAETRRALL